jgi:hypothetical protein
MTELLHAHLCRQCGRPRVCLVMICRATVVKDCWPCHLRADGAGPHAAPLGSSMTQRGAGGEGRDGFVHRRMGLACPRGVA